jgi:hypothetical protein
LLEKLATRDPKRRAFLLTVNRPQPHPLFRVVRGSVAPWEKGRGAAGPRYMLRRYCPPTW